VALAAVAGAAIITNETMPINVTIENACTGEIVDFTGSCHNIRTITPNKNGGEQQSFISICQATGVGETTGTPYILSAEGPTVMTFNAGGNTQTAHEDFQVISVGSAPNFVIHTLFHITINPDGTTTSSVDTITSECRG
jgi:hypothetical protein